MDKTCRIGISWGHNCSMIWYDNDIINQIIYSLLNHGGRGFRYICHVDGSSICEISLK